MKIKERKYLERLYKCLKIPSFASGLKTTTVKGLSLYSKDCTFAIPKTQDILFAIGNEESYSGETEELLIEFEKWYQQRMEEDWE